MKAILSLSETERKEKIYMPQYRVGLICSNPRVLPELSNRLKEPWSTISEEEGMYDWSSSQFEALATVTEVDECATRLLPTLDGLVKLPFIVNLPFINEGELAKAGRIKFVNDQGREVTQVILSGTLSGRGTISIHEDEDSQREARRRGFNIAEKSLEAEESSPVHHVLSYYRREANWHNLYDIYEIVRRKCDSDQFEKWMQDETGTSRKSDFEQSANNFNLSGFTARHSLAKSDLVEMIPNSSKVKVHNRKGVLYIRPMTLDQAKKFITHLITQWLPAILEIN
jgi:hypothetical protein